MSNVDNRFEQPGAGGTDNTLVLGGSVETPTGANLKVSTLTNRIEDVSTAGQVFVVAPFAGSITKVTSVLNGAIATSDATLTVVTTAGTAGNLVIATAGSAKGDIDTLVPSVNNLVAAGEAIEIQTDGASTNAVGVDLLVEIAVS